MSQYTTYILRSSTAMRFYVGLTSDPNRRLIEHQQGKSRWSSQAKDWREIWCSERMPLADARSLEKRIKARGAKRFLHDKGISGLD